MTSPSLALTVRRTIAAPAERVFAAWTDPEALRQWWGPPGVTCPEATIDLRVGGTYSIANRLEDGTTVWIRGEFVRIQSPTLLVYTWGVDPHPAVEMVTVRFEPSGQQTEVVVHHERIATEEARDDHRAGWYGCLDGLVRLFGGS